LNDKNNAGYWNPIKILDRKKGRFHWSDLERINQSNALFPHFSNIQDLLSEGLLSILFPRKMVNLRDISANRGKDLLIFLAAKLIIN
jgi:hypothetical protein